MSLRLTDNQFDHLGKLLSKSPFAVRMLDIISAGNKLSDHLKYPVKDIDSFILRASSVGFLVFACNSMYVVDLIITF
jgi:hypothetical protein